MALLSDWVKKVANVNKVRKERLAICHVCPEYTANKKCRACGCPVAGKVLTGKCPLNKW